MNPEQAEHISLLAAPIYVMLLAKEVRPGEQTIIRLADASIALARTLWLRTLEAA